MLHRKTKHPENRNRLKNKSSHHSQLSALKPLLRKSLFTMRKTDLYLVNKLVIMLMSIHLFSCDRDEKFMLCFSEEKLEAHWQHELNKPNKHSDQSHFNPLNLFSFSKRSTNGVLETSSSWNHAWLAVTESIFHPQTSSGSMKTSRTEEKHLQRDRDPPDQPQIAEYFWSITEYLPLFPPASNHRLWYD